MRVDAQDNIWIVDEGSNQVIKFGPDGRVLMILGRKPEAMTIRVPPARRRRRGGGRRQGGARRARRAPGAGGAGDQFTRPSDVAWDADGNIFVADGHGANARIAKFDKNGRFIASWGSRGSEPGQFDTPHSHRHRRRRATSTSRIRATSASRSSTTPARSSRRSPNIGVPTALCISRGSHPYLYSSHSGDPYGMDDAAIYKLELDGRIVGKFGKAGKLPKELGLVNAIDCRTENELYVGELTNWRVQKLILKPSGPRSLTPRLADDADRDASPARTRARAAARSSRRGGGRRSATPTGSPLAVNPAGTEIAGFAMNVTYQHERIQSM